MKLEVKVGDTVLLTGTGYGSLLETVAAVQGNRIVLKNGQMFNNLGEDKFPSSFQCIKIPNELEIKSATQNMLILAIESYSKAHKDFNYHLRKIPSEKLRVILEILEGADG